MNELLNENDITNFHVLILLNKTIKLRKNIKTLKIQDQIPLKYWGICVLSTTHIINKLPSIALENKTPCEVLNN